MGGWEKLLRLSVTEIRITGGKVTRGGKLSRKDARGKLAGVTRKHSLWSRFRPNERAISEQIAAACCSCMLLRLAQRGRDQLK